MSERGAKIIGKPCRRCGGTERYVVGGACVSCRLGRNKWFYRAMRDEHLSKTKAWHRDNREAHNALMRIGQLRRKFGLTAAEYDHILESQNGRCAICMELCPTGRRLAVDHHHATGTVRGLLCNACNLGVGKFQDSPDLLGRAIEYLKRYAIQDITNS